MPSFLWWTTTGILGICFILFKGPIILVCGLDYMLHSCVGDIKRDTGDNSQSVTSHASAVSHRLDWIQDSFYITPLPTSGAAKWMKVRINYLRLPFSHDCAKEKIVIFAGKVTHPASCVTYCGEMTNVELLVKTRKTVIRFEGHTSRKSNGFSLHFQCVPAQGHNANENTACHKGEYACLPKYFVNIHETICLDRKKLCDGIVHCPFGDDEWRKTCKTLTYLKNVTAPGVLGSPPGTYKCACQGPQECNGDLIIDKAKLCDGIRDCPFGDDEVCSPGCEKDQFKCSASSNACLSKSYFCDGQTDCETGLDETLCSETVVPTSSPVLATLQPFPAIWPTCESRQFTCHQTKTCIPQAAICDTIMDCPGGEDEAPYTCNQKQCPSRQAFNCKSTDTCVDRRLLCDGIKDCPAGEDESKETCSLHVIITTPSPQVITLPPIVCPADYFLCTEAGRCIPQNWVCDNYPDCSSSEDELPSLCNKHSESANVTTSTPTQGLFDLAPFLPVIPETRTVTVQTCSTATGGGLLCPNDKWCLPKELVCDKVKDCSDGYDESTEACNFKSQILPEDLCLFEEKKCGTTGKNKSTNLPWLVLVQKSGIAQCTGVLVKKEWVLIGPGCVKRIKQSFQNTTVISYRVDTFQNDTGSEELKYYSRVSGLMFDDQTGIGALLIRPQPDPVVCIATETKFDPSRCYIMGWGVDDGTLSSEAKAVPVTLLEIEKCSNISDVYSVTSNNSICATWSLKDIITGCMRYYGGSLLCQDPQSSQWSLQGVYVGGSECSAGNMNGPMLFQRYPTFATLFSQLKESKNLTTTLALESSLPCAPRYETTGLKNFYNLQIIQGQRYCALIPIGSNWLLTQATCAQYCNIFGGSFNCSITENGGGQTRDFDVLRVASHSIPSTSSSIPTQKLLLLQIKQSTPKNVTFCLGRVNPTLRNCIIMTPRRGAESHVFFIDSAAFAKGGQEQCNQPGVNFTYTFTNNSEYFEIRRCSSKSNDWTGRNEICPLHASPMFCQDCQGAWKLVALANDINDCNETFRFTVVAPFLPSLETTFSETT